MTKQRNALKAGLFIVISLFLVVGIVVAIKGVKRFIEPSKHHEVSFALADDIGGLAEGDPVRIGGAAVGSVRSIDLQTETANPGIVITFAIPRRYTVHEDAVLTVQSTITGVSVLNFESLGKGKALPEGGMLIGKPNPSFTALAAAAQELIGDARNTTLPKINNAIDVYKDTGQNATKFIKHVDEKIDPVVDRYYEFADKGKFALNEVGTLFGDTKADFRSTVANLSSATGNIKDKMPSILEKVEGTLTKIQSALDKTSSALDDVKLVAENAREASSSARSILGNNRSKIDNMIASLKTAGDNLKFATAEIRRSPWRLLYKPGPGEMANLNIYDSARQFAEGANSMSDAAEALRDALKDPKTDDKRVEELVQQLDTSFQKFNQVESELWKQVKE